MKVKKRKCQGCCELKDADFMIKITKLHDKLKINPKSTELGRSMYICKNPECIKITIKKKRIKSALKFSNSSEIERIEKELKNMI